MVQYIEGEQKGLAEGWGKSVVRSGFEGEEINS